MTQLSARSREARGSRSLRSGLVFSGVAHVALVALFVVVGLQHDAPRPPVYRVEMIGAPKGARQAGVVTPSATPYSA